MPLPRHMLESMAERRQGRERCRPTATRRGDYVLTALTCFVWCGIGTFLIAWSAHTTDETLGNMAFWGGLGVGNTGIIYTLLAAYRRGEKRGDW